MTGKSKWVRGHSEKRWLVQTVAQDLLKYAWECDLKAFREGW
jgi:hypothetical protein